MKKYRNIIIPFVVALIVVIILLFTSKPAETAYSMPSVGEYMVGLNVGKTLNLHVVNNYTSNKPTFTSLTPRIVKVSKTGKVKGLKKGVGTIRVKIGNYYCYSTIIVSKATKKVTVNSYEGYEPDGVVYAK